MLFHLSIDADRPKHVAEVLAELWQGAAMPFPPVLTGSWAAFANDDRATMVEVYPRGAELHESAGGVIGVIGTNNDRSATHFAMATPLQEAEVLAIATREGWPAMVCNRGGLFDVIEVYVEGTRMIEVLTTDMQADYLRTMTVPNWRAMLNSARLTA
jgi:hypothetical protein